jgi:tetratricopeptide (TPR) repeat protein
MKSLNTLLQDAKALAVQGKHKEAITTLDILVQRTSAQKGQFLAAALNSRGIAKRMLGDYDAAFQDYQAALRAESDNEEKASSHINIADIHRVAKADYISAHASLDEALTFCSNGTLLHAKAIDQRGLVFFAQKDYASAIVSYERAKAITLDLLATAPQDKDVQNRYAQDVQNRYAQIMQHLGGAFLYMNDPTRVEEAYKTQLDALRIFKRLGDNVGIFNSVSVIGKIAVNNNDFKKAVEHYKIAYEILEGTIYERGIAGLHLDMSEAQLNLKEFKAAQTYISKFVDGVKAGHLTEYDLSVMNEQFKRVEQLSAEKPQLTQLLIQVATRFVKAK